MAGFQLDKVAPGRYLFVASYVGYQDQRQPLTVPAGGAPVVLAPGGAASRRRGLENGGRDRPGSGGSAARRYHHP
ncbi:MAG: hypothetical protein WKG07_37495 [Hymenobacter sp.]